MSELLAEVLTNKSARKTTALRSQAASKAQLGYGWGGADDVEL